MAAFGKEQIQEFFPGVSERGGIRIGLKSYQVVGEKEGKTVGIGEVERLVAGIGAGVAGVGG